MAEAILKDKEWKDYLKKISNKINDLKGLASAAAPTVYGDIIRHFEQQRGEFKGWEKWSESYTNYMAKIGKGGNKILQDNGRLRQSFQASNYRTGKGQITWFNNATTKGGFPYAYAHDNDESPRKRLPRREFMWLSENALSVIAKIMIDKVGE